jgi:hypothetical protein
MQWRRSYEVAPPSLYDVDFAKRMGTNELLRGTTIMNEKYVDSTLLDETLRSAGNTETVTSAIFPANAALNYGRCLAPSTESLQQCEQRVFGYWKQVIAPRVKAGDRVLIVAHANTLRALVKAIDKIEDKKIPMLKIPNGIPLVYTLNEQLDPVDPPDQSNVIGFNGAFLVSARNHDKVRHHAGTGQTMHRQLCDVIISIVCTDDDVRELRKEEATLSIPVPGYRRERHSHRRGAVERSHPPKRVQEQLGRGRRWQQ